MLLLDRMRRGSIAPGVHQELSRRTTVPPGVSEIAPGLDDETAGTAALLLAQAVVGGGADSASAPRRHSCPETTSDTAHAHFYHSGQEKFRLGVSYWIQKPANLRRRGTLGPVGDAPCESEAPADSSPPSAGSGPTSTVSGGRALRAKCQNLPPIFNRIVRLPERDGGNKPGIRYEADPSIRTGGVPAAISEGGPHARCPVALPRTGTMMESASTQFCAATNRPSLVVLGCSDNGSSSVPGAAGGHQKPGVGISFTTPAYVSFDFTERPLRYSSEEWQVMEANDSWDSSARRMRSTIFLEAMLASLSQVVETLDLVSKAYPVCSSHVKPSRRTIIFSKAIGLSDSLGVVSTQFQYVTGLVEHFPEMFINPFVKLMEAEGKHVIVPQNLAPLQHELRKKKATVLTRLENILHPFSAKRPISKSLIRGMLSQLQSAIHRYYNLTLQWARVVLDDFTLLVRTHSTQTRYGQRIDRMLQDQLEEMPVLDVMGLLLYAFPQEERLQLVQDLGGPFSVCRGPLCTLALLKHKRSFVNPLSKAAEAALAILRQDCQTCKHRQAWD